MTNKEKIRQFVNMARHPEAKSYEEALEVDTINFENSICFDSVQNKICLYHQVKNIIKPQHIIKLGRPITAFDVCWALNKKTGEFDFKIERRGISFTRICTMEADGNFVSCMPLLKNIKNGIFVFEIIESDGTHTVLEDWDDKVCEDIVKLINL